MTVATDTRTVAQRLEDAGLIPREPEQPVVSLLPRTSDVPNAYGRRALEDETARVAGAPEGTRNHTLNAAAYSLGTLVGARVLDERTVATALTDAGRAAGLAGREIEATIRSGLRAGISNPRAVPELAPTAQRPAAQRPTAVVTLNEAHATFRRWLGADYDTDALDAVLAAAAVERLDGDPLWLLLVSGSGNAKTETVQALVGGGATMTSTIASAGALLSATSRKERANDATGGLLRQLGDRGVLVVKDVTSILSMSRDMRGEVLAALREVYDGSWSRSVGTDGGRTLEWTGRLAVVGAVTTAWDQAHSVIASMGDRFVLVRMDSNTGRVAAGQRAIGNTGDEARMRAELAAAVGGVLAGVQPGEAVRPTAAEIDALLEAANVVTLSRTGVVYDYRGDVIDAHAPEMPTRFAKQLTQVMRGAVALGADRSAALRLAIRCARDSMPPLRLAILDDVALHPQSAVKDVRRRLGKPRATVDRELQALHMLGVLTVEEEEGEHRGLPVTVWRYSVTEGINPNALDSNSVPEMSVPTPNPQEEGRRVHLPTHISGTGFGEGSEAR